MYNNLIQDDIIVLDNEFFKINMMFETVDRIYDIKMKELEYNYLYTENVDIEFVDLYTEAENTKTNKQQGLLSRMFTAILNFIRSIRAKILRLFGNDKKAKELEDKIKGDPKLANQTVEIVDCSDSMKAINDGTSFFGKLIDKVIGGKATEKDADEAEKREGSLVKILTVAAASYGVGAMANENSKKKKISSSQLIQEEETIKKELNDTSQKNEEKLQQGQQAIDNQSSNGNEENTKAGKRILNCFKNITSKIGTFFTNRVADIKSKKNQLTSKNNSNTSDKNGKKTNKRETATSESQPKNNNTEQTNDDTKTNEEQASTNKESQKEETNKQNKTNDNNTEQTNDDTKKSVSDNNVSSSDYNNTKTNEEQPSTNKESQKEETNKQDKTNDNNKKNDQNQPQKEETNKQNNTNDNKSASTSVNDSNTITTVENRKIVMKLRQEECTYLCWNVPLKCFEETPNESDIIVDPSTNFAYINEIVPEFDISLDVGRAYDIKEKTHIDKTYKIKLAKYVPPPSSSVGNIIKGKIYKDSTNNSKENNETFKESSYDLINNILTPSLKIVLNKGERNMNNTKVLNFIDELEQKRRNEVDNNRFKDSISYKYNCLNNAKKDGVEECLSKSFEKFYLDAIPLNDEYKTANHDDLCNDVHDFIKKNGAKSMTYYVGEARKKSPVMKKLYESVEKLVDDKFKEKEEKINETKPELDLVFKMDGETEKKIDVINQDLELDDIAKVISDNVRNTAMSEINRAKEEKENMKQIETDLANDVNVKSEAAIERELSLRGINQKAVFQPSLFEGIMIGKMNKLSYTTESTDDVYLYNAMKDYTGAFYEGGDSATPEEIAFVESVRELTLLSMERALKIKKYSLQDIKNLANEYASMK